MTQQDHSEDMRDRTVVNDDWSDLDYENGLNRLLQELGQDHSCYSEVLVLQHRLMENIKQSQLYGDNQTRRAERSEIIDRLNRLTLANLGISFADLCRLSPPTPPPPPPSSPSFEDFGFQDCKILLKRILQSKANHIELYGPCGVGKTYLLQHLAKRHDEIGSVYIDLTRRLNIADILPEVVTQLKGTRPKRPVETRDFAQAISNLYDPEAEPSVKHFVFLFDSADEEKDRELIDWLISGDGLINNGALFDFLERLGIQRDEVKLQVVIAARRPVVKVEEYHPNFHFDRIGMERLAKDPDPTEDAIQGMLRELADYNGFNLVPATCQEYSDEVYYLTGGHPKCAKLVLFALADVGFLPKAGDWKEFFEKHVLCTIKSEMLRSIPDDLVPVFHVLSVLRRFDQPMLASLVEHGILEIPTSAQGTSRRASRLRRRLVDTYLVAEPHIEIHKGEPIFEPMFTMNFAVRRALSLRMQYKSPQRYRAINQAVLEILQSRLQSARPNPGRSVISLIEIVYHRLKALEMDPQVKDVCSQIKGQLQEYLQQLLEAIDEDDWPTYLPMLRAYWGADRELRETARRATGGSKCYDILLRDIKQFVSVSV